MNQPGTKILIADDDELIAQALEVHLSGHGYTVVHAKDGEAALQLAESERPAVIVLDIMMPGLDGMEVLRRLQEKESTRGVPVIMSTARQFRDDVLAALKHGARDYLVKPFSPEALLARVEKALARSSTASDTSTSS